MASIINMPIGGYPLVLYGMIALTTAVLAYATISSGSSDNAGASVSSSVEKSSESMLSGILGNSSTGESKPAEGSLGSSNEPKEESEEQEPNPVTGGKGKKRRTKNKRTKRRSAKTKRK